MKNEKWSINDMPGLRGKLVIVTGGNSGLGFESVKAFAAKGAQVILAARSIKRGKSAKKKILEDYPNSKINVMKLDLANLESIHYFVKHFKKQYRKLNILLKKWDIKSVRLCATSYTYYHYNVRTPLQNWENKL